MVVDDVELAGRRCKEAGLGVRELDVLGVSKAVDDVAIAEGRGRDAPKARLGQRITAREQGHVVATSDELFG